VVLKPAVEYILSFRAKFIFPIKPDLSLPAEIINTLNKRVRYLYRDTLLPEWITKGLDVGRQELARQLPFVNRQSFRNHPIFFRTPGQIRSYLTKNKIQLRKSDKGLGTVVVTNQ